MSYELRDLPTKVLDLDKAPNERWVDIVTEYKDEITEAYNVLYDRIYQLLGAYGRSIFNALLSAIVNGYGHRNHYYDELMSISKVLDIPFHKVVVCQYGYELFTCCTSAIFLSRTRKTTHLRTMDWNDNSLRPLTIHLKVIREGKLVADTTTWVGFIGFYTIVKPGVCSLSVNYRRSGNIEPHKNLWGIITGRSTVSYMVREAMLNNDSYDDIIKHLKFTPLSAPCYLTIASVDFEKSMILVRDRTDCHTFLMDTKVGYLVQPNNDPWDHRESTNRQKSIERRQLFNNRIYDKVKFATSKEEMFKTFLEEPILKFNNIYGNVMVPEDEYEPNYTKYILPGSDLELMIDGFVLKFWEQVPPDAYEKKNDSEITNTSKDDDNAMKDDDKTIKVE